MRFLVDAQLPPALARRIAAVGHPCEHVADCGLLTAPDPAIRAYAATMGAAIITKDEDFAVHLLLHGGPAVVWLRLAVNVRVALLSSLLAACAVLISGIWPLWRASARQPMDRGLPGSSRTVPRRPAGRLLFVCAQVAACTALAVGSTVAYSQVRTELGRPLGFDARRLIAATIDVTLPTATGGPRGRRLAPAASRSSIRVAGGRVRRGLRLRAPQWGRRRASIGRGR